MNIFVNMLIMLFLHDLRNKSNVHFTISKLNLCVRQNKKYRCCNFIYLTIITLFSCKYVAQQSRFLSRKCKVRHPSPSHTIIYK